MNEPALSGTRVGLYPGSFDPLTLGHVDVMVRAAALVDRLVIAIGVHPGKTPMLDVATRTALIDREILERGLSAEVSTFDGLVTAHAVDLGASVIFRGVRGGLDLDYEMQMAGMNAGLAPGVQTVFLPASPGMGHIAGTQVRQIARMGGDVSGFVPRHAVDALKAALAAIS